MLRTTVYKHKLELIIRIMIIISSLAALAGSLLPMFTVQINIMGMTIYHQEVGLLSPLKDHAGGQLERIQSLGLESLGEVREKILKVITLPVSLYLTVILLVIIVMICTLLNKLGRVKMLLSVASVGAAIYLISVMQAFPDKLIQVFHLNNKSGFINWNKFLKIHAGNGIWIMLAAVISVAAFSIIHAMIRAKGRPQTKTK